MSTHLKRQSLRTPPSTKSWMPPPKATTDRDGHNSIVSSRLRTAAYIVVRTALERSQARCRMNAVLPIVLKEQSRSHEKSVDDTLVMYSDSVCPFCYLGRHSLDQYQEKREDDFEIARQREFSECRTHRAVMAIMPTQRRSRSRAGNRRIGRGRCVALESRQRRRRSAAPACVHDKSESSVTHTRRTRPDIAQGQRE